MEEQMEGVWKPRLAAAADPFESSLQRERVRRLSFLHASSHLCESVTPRFFPESHDVCSGLSGVIDSDKGTVLPICGSDTF